MKEEECQRCKKKGYYQKNREKILERKKKERLEKGQRNTYRGRGRQYCTDPPQPFKIVRYDPPFRVIFE